ncbi:MAG TPA: hypothetical protein VFN29_02965 [Chiayiivirga sp.]|nr:hypothetical protein [Chiayiivirga sp.]
MKQLFRTSFLLLAVIGMAQAQGNTAPVKAASPSAEFEQKWVARIAEVKDPSVLTQLIAEAHAAGSDRVEMAALDRRIALRPHIGVYKLDKAAALARADRKSEAYTLLVELQNTGYGYDLHDDRRFDKISKTEVWKYILDNFDANRAAFGNGSLAYTLPREDLLLESVAWDPSREQLLAGSARDGKVYSVAADGSIKALATADAENGMWSVFDLTVDAKRGVIWVASTAVPHFKYYDATKDLGRAGVFKFDLKTGKFLNRYLSPAMEPGGLPYFLSSIAVGSDGAAYAADGVNRAIYQVRDEQFRRILHLPMLTSISAITVSGDGKKLYFADPQLGIMGVDLGTLKVFDVRVPAKLSLEGISDLTWYDGALIAVQSGMNPRRVMRFDLSAEGDTIDKVLPLEANNPQFGIPGAMTMDGSTIYVVANDQKDKYDRFGLLKSKDALEGTRIVRLSANFKAVDPNQLGPIDFSKFQEHDSK